MVLAEKIALVTGARRGMGRASALQYAQTGAAVAPEDIAAMAVFLASPGARNITGQAFNVDGGLVMS